MSERALLRRSINTERALTAPRPRLRGRSHLVAAVVALPAVVVWTLSVAGVRERLAVLAFAGGVGAMFALSALLHLRPWKPATYERLFRLDHTGIFLAIGGTGVALGLVGLEGWPGRVLVTCAIVGTVVGIVVEWMPFAPPRGFANAVYLTFGWIPAVLLPWFWTSSGAVAVGLLLLGGILYTVGAVIVAIRRPDPSPLWFGYHEVFHVLVIGAVAAHTVMFVRLLDP